VTNIEVDEPSAPATPARVRVRRRRTPKQKRLGFLRVTGCTLLLAGTLMLGWLAWQFWGTNWVSHHRQAEVVQSLQVDWGNGQATSETSWGTANAILRVPRFGNGYQIPVLEGSTDEVLAAGIGHLEDTEAVGEVGNYALAAHRVTHGEPFARFPDLEVGDLIYVDTRSVTYTYVLDTGGTDLTVPFTAAWVLAAFPRNPDPLGTTPPEDVGDHLITLMTCSEIFHTDNRSVAFGHLVNVSPRVP
jgi:sortase A